jgi:hypothetical protein
VPARFALQFAAQHKDVLLFDVLLFNVYLFNVYLFNVYLLDVYLLDVYPLDVLLLDVLLLELAKHIERRPQLPALLARWLYVLRHYCDPVVLLDVRLAIHFH